MAAVKNRLSWLSEQRFVAVVPGILLLVYFAATARYSIAMLDESALWLLSNRLSLGDRMISDEWHLIQFSALIEVPFYSLYTRLVGSTEGLILVTRYFFIVFDVLFYCFMCRKLRRFHTAGVAAAFLFCAMVPELFFAFSYCTVSAFALMGLLLCLLADETGKRPAGYIVLGGVLAVIVLENPFLLVMYLLWALFVAANAVNNKMKKRIKFLQNAAFLLETKLFLLVTLGSFIIFAAFVVILFLNGAFDEIRTVLPYLFSGAEYNSGNLFNADQLIQTVGFYGRGCVIGLLCCSAGAAVLRLLRLRYKALRIGLLLVAAAFFAACCIHAGVKMIDNQQIFHMTMFCQSHNFPLLLFAPVPFLLSEKNDSRRICAVIAGYLYSLLMDIPSQSFIGIGGFIVRVPLVLQLWEMRRLFFSPCRRKSAVDSIPADRGGRSPVAAVGAVAAVCLAVCLVWDAAYIGAEGLYKAPEKLFLCTDQPLSYSLQKGPLKGLKTTPALGEIYDATLRDMDLILQTPDCAVAMLDSLSYPYLYLNRPYATFSMTYSGEFDRLLAYWNLQYTTKPDYLYLPYYNPFLMFHYDYGYLNARLAEVRNHTDCDVTQGEAGYIIRVYSVDMP